MQMMRSRYVCDQRRLALVSHPYDPGVIPSKPALLELLGCCNLIELISADSYRFQLRIKKEAGRQ